MLADRISPVAHQADWPVETDRQSTIDWIVVEAKDERNAFSTEVRREALFAQKQKYVTPDTAWFVMVDPSVIVARPVISAELTIENDIIFRFDGVETEADFRRKFGQLAAGVAGVPERLKAFRAGDISKIATEKLLAPPDASKRIENQVAVARRNFYSALRLTTQALQDATLQTLRSVQPRVSEIQAAASEFATKYGACHFDPYTLTVRGEPSGYELTRSHGGDAARLSRTLKRAGSIARLALDGLPQFRARVNADTEGKLLEMFATETANLVLARILLIRFFEDHGFFGLHRYVCNGGVEAFQKMRETFEHGYTRLLHLAYEKAQRLYAAAFDETELDWVFDTNNPGLSAAIEWAMYQLSRYDFTTVKGDILTGIYDRFLDREQRKRFGEYYTPPSIARFIIDSLALNDDDRLLDPACGSGTFLIERYQQTAGEDAERGIATYPQVVEALGHLAGNDLNTFSAVLAQIQLLWHVLSFRDDLLRGAEFPDIAVSDKSSSILQAELDVSSHGRWVELDQPIYGGVAGNPPYVRPERSGELDPVTTGYFGAPRSKPGNVEGWKGISAEANLYALFIFKALDAWCRKPDRWGGGAGRLGYVVPLAFCGTNENADLRSLFAPGGRCTIREIVDLEVIWRHIFDADVLPIILIAEARPPRLPIHPALLERGAKLPADLTLAHQVRANRLHLWLEARATKAIARRDQKRTEGLHALIERNKMRWIPDKVIIRLADKSCIDFMDGLKRPKFDIAGLPTTSVDYADLFSPDGRILTRLNPERIRIIKKLRKNQHFSQALQPYWYKRRGADRGAVRITRPASGQQDWESREMISRGIVYAGGKSILASGGHTVYKAENILSGALHGDPQDSNVDISKARNRYLFDYPDILPNRMWAVAMIAVCPNAVAFDPRETVFTDTATVFGPRSDLTEFPFDLYFLSRVCMYFYVLASRMSYLNMNRSHIYPTNLRLLPWNEALGASANRLEALRPSLLSTCQTAFQTEAAMFAELEGLELPLLRDAVRASSGTKIVWSDSFLKAAEKVEVNDAIAISSGEAGQRLQVSSYTFDWLEINSEDLVVGLEAALMARPGILVDRETLLAMPIPVDNEGRTRFNEIVNRYRAGDHMKEIEAVIDQIDAIVGPALGLNSLDLSTIQADMVDDPFLKNIKPRYPASVTRLHGYRTGLDSSERYD